MPIRRFVWLAVLFAPLFLPFSILRLPSTLAFFCVLPALALASRTRRSPLGVVALTLNVSPILFGSVTLLATAVGMSIAEATWTALAATTVAFAIFGSRFEKPDESTTRLLVAIGVITAVVAAIVFFLPITNEWWRTRSDSWFHAAAFNRLALHGLPITDPYFSQIPLQYMYLYHILLGAITTLTRLDVFNAMIFLNFVALVNVIAAFVWLTGRFAKTNKARLLSLILCLFGMNGFFFLFVPIRLAQAVFGETKDYNFLASFFTTAMPGHHAAAAVLSVNVNQFMFLEKFMLGTAIMLSIGAMCAAWCLAIAPKAENKSVCRAISYVLLGAGTIMLHIIIGATFAAAVLGASLLTWIVQKRRSRGGDSGTLFLLTCLSILVVGPYLMSVMQSDYSGSSFKIRFQPGHTLGLIASILSAVPWAITYLVHRSGKNVARPERSFVLLWLGFVLLAALLVDLTTTSETKFSFLLFVPLAAISAAGFQSAAVGRRWRTAILYMVMVTVPLNGIYFYHALRDESQLFRSDDSLEAFQWIQAMTDTDAIFLDENDILDIPVLGSRDLFWGSKKYARIWGYDEKILEARLQIRNKTYSGEELTPADFQPVRRLRRPFYVLCRTEGIAGSTAARRLVLSGVFTLAHKVGSIEIYKMKW
ncbi:MAG: hypothetical protein O7D32_00625 [bacterium]|nr:hypothetical protein [bacterium]